MIREFCKSFSLPNDLFDYLEFINNHINIVTKKIIEAYPQELTILICVYYHVDEYASIKNYINGCFVYVIPGGEDKYNSIIGKDMIKITSDILKPARKEAIMLGFVEYEDYSREEDD